MEEAIKIFTDGACRGNPGPGGWGALIIKKQEEFTLWGGENDTTNNKMEMTAAIKALEYFKESSDIHLTTDSNYVKDGIESWIEGWKRNGWKTASKKPVKNVELWKKLKNLSSNHSIKWIWVKGHAQNKYNNLVDELAQGAIKR